MDKAPFPPTGGQQQPGSNTAHSDTNVFSSKGRPYPEAPIPPSTCDTWRSPVPSNMCNANTGAFWPSQNSYQQAAHSQQTSASGPRFSSGQTEWPPRFQPAPGYGNQEYGHRPHFPQPPQRYDGYSTPNSSGYDFNPSVPPPPFYGTESYPYPVPSESQSSAAYCSSQSDSNMHDAGRSVNSWAHAYGTGAPNLQRTFDQTPVYPNAGTQFRQPGYQVQDVNRQKHADGFFSVNFERHIPGSLHHDGDNARWPNVSPRNQGFSDSANVQESNPEYRQRILDEQWIKRFLLNKKKKHVSKLKETHRKISVSHIRDHLYRAVRLVSELSAACKTLKLNLENDSLWTDSYSKALVVKRDLQEKLTLFSDPIHMKSLKNKVVSINKKRARQRRQKRDRLEDKLQEQERIAEREASIDKWRMKRIQEVEEKKRALELKAAADAVLSEVRKKQADARRMLDVLKSLEKLRKLRKEAASRKGIFPEKEQDEEFAGHVERLRRLIGTRTGVYGAEEKALRVMLEGEQEEERRREQDKRLKRERERLLKRRWQLETALFGDEMPAGHPLQPFLDYYTQAKRSLHTLIQIRREWDQFLVPVDHSDGSCIPQDWVFPVPPTDEVWATALDQQNQFTE